MKNTIYMLYLFLFACSSEPTKSGTISMSDAAGKTRFTSEPFEALIINRTSGVVILKLPDSAAEKLKTATSGHTGLWTVKLDEFEIGKINVVAPTATNTVILKADSIDEFFDYLNRVGYDYTIDDHHDIRP